MFRDAGYKLTVISETCNLQLEIYDRGLQIELAIRQLRV
jgi:hypothetical protein